MCVLSGLLPGTTYYYKVADTSGSTDGEAKLAQARQSGKTHTFTVRQQLHDTDAAAPVTFAAADACDTARQACHACPSVSASKTLVQSSRHVCWACWALTSKQDALQAVPQLLASHCCDGSLHRVADLVLIKALDATCNCCLLLCRCRSRVAFH